MRANSSFGFVESSKKAIENNVHIRQQLLWVTKSCLMRSTNQELKITLYSMQFKLIDVLTVARIDTPIKRCPDRCPTDAVTDGLVDAPTETLTDAGQAPNRYPNRGPDRCPNRHTACLRHSIHSPLQSMPLYCRPACKHKYVIR